MTARLPGGLYDLVLTERLEALVDKGASTLRDLQPSESARLAEVLHKQLVNVLDDLSSSESMTTQLALINDLISELNRRAEARAGHATDRVVDPPRLLTSVRRHGADQVAPEIGLSVPWLFTAGKGSPSLLSELRRELGSAEQVDILVSFITVSGVRKLRDVLERITAVGADGHPPVSIRVLTTTYIGATEQKAVDELASLAGCQVKISLDGRRTRLHAKAWIFHRQTGFGSAYVGSANMTGAALIGGLEWTVKFTQSAQAELYTKAKAHFDTLWEDPEFQRYDPQNEAHRDALSRALGRERGTAATSLESFFELQPKTYQQEMLEQLAHERLHGRNRNLVVAATGTGKTVVAAFDYRNTCNLTKSRPRLLFVAHRREILEQALRTYREVLRDGSFGQLLTGQDQPTSFEHLFATIDSAASQKIVARFGASYWHTVVIDECHRIAGARFDELVSSLHPSILLGLTATPERADGQPIHIYFDARPDGSPAVELRLWDALELQLLAPFEYYACDDETDFSLVPWRRVGEQQAIAELVSNNEVRARTVLREWHRLASDPRASRALIFCVSVEHAKFMAGYLSVAGYPVVSVHGSTPQDERRSALERLRSGDICGIATVDLYNEGIDIPTVDTLLLLRPTQSPVVFQQQLGRGLRLFEGKESCLVLDFVGHHNTEFRYDRLLSVITGQSRRELLESLEHGFSNLPSGCHIQLQHQVRERVLSNLRQQIQSHWRALRSELKAAASLKGATPTLGEFLHSQALPLEDVYRNSNPRGWTSLQRASQLLVSEPGPEERYLSERLASLRHRNAPNQIRALRIAADVAKNARPMDPEESLLVQILAYQVDGTSRQVGSAEDFVYRVRSNPTIISELEQLADVLEAKSTLPSVPLPGLEDTLLELHGNYERREILTAVGYMHSTARPRFDEGALRLKDRRAEILFVTLDKSVGYHDGIAYHDYAVSRTQFHWQTQNSTGPDTAVGRRYLESPGNGWSFHLFVREHPEAPFVACGPVELLEATGARPMNILWNLTSPLTAHLFQKFSVLRG